MARPASRKAVSSLPAIANIDEQLDEVVMSDIVEIEEVLVIGGNADGQRATVAKSIDVLFSCGQEYKRKHLAVDSSYCSLFVPSNGSEPSVKEIISKLIQCYSPKEKGAVMSLDMAMPKKTLAISK
ncbi:hypothetical protein DNW18_23375 [Salmonella enterica subsp. enterica serovar Guildford]|nr:hypothetical protein [Salmonella enterica subsp. enterica serovar Guildford]